MTENLMSVPAPKQVEDGRPAAHVRSMGWVVRRTLLGLVVLIGIVVSGAWLLYASIDVDAEAAEQQRSSE